jgi:hypothetical protein
LIATMDWSAALVLIVMFVTFGFIATAAMASRYAKGVTRGGPMIGPKRFDEIEEDLAAIRADLAEIKESLAEIDRMFKSVG